jgi:hypothetical protein
MSAYNGKTKYDWIELKQRYLDSIYTNVREFFRQELGISEDSFFNSGNYSRETNGWKTDKEIYQLEKNKEAQRLMKEHYAISYADLYKWKSTALQAAAIQLKQGLILEGDKIKGVSLKPKELETLWKIIKTELNEPTTVSKSNIEGIGETSELQIQINLTRELQKDLANNLGINPDVEVETSSRPENE